VIAKDEVERESAAYPDFAFLVGGADHEKSSSEKSSRKAAAIAAALAEGFFVRFERPLSSILSLSSINSSSSP
jgi:hypothetical protein